MITYLQAVAVIEDYATQHYMVQKFGYEFKEQMPNIATEDEKYPMVFVVPVGALATTNTNEFEIDVYCLDRYMQDRTNVSSVVSDTQFILGGLTKWLEEGVTTLDVIHSYPMTPINNDLLDYCGGWVLRLRLEVDMIALCEIPLSGTTPIPTPTCDDATQIIEDSFGNELYVNTITSGSTETQIIADSTAVLKDTSGTAISTTSILAEGSEDIIAPDTTLEVNGTIEGTVASGSTVDIQLSDSGGVVTPTSVTQVGNDFQVVLPDASSVPIGATLMQTGQTVSYRSGDNPTVGRDVDFLTLASNNPFGNTNRFTDELGGSTYTKNIVIDWSTYDGSTVLGYDRRVNGGGANTDKTWNNAIDEALAHSIVGYTSGWRLTNRTEALNICSDAAITTWLNYAPFNLSASVGFWVSNTIATSTANSTFFFPVNRTLVQVSKTSAGSLRWLACRTFTVTGTTLT